MKSVIIMIACLMEALAFDASAAIVGQEVIYQADNATLQGYIAYDEAVEKRRPGILVVHEWWGHDAYARRRATMLAELGYTALALDMYGKGKQATHPEEAGRFAGEIRENLPLARTRFLAALELLRRHDAVDPEQTAAIGYCFGGSIVLEMARAGIDLDGVASFHGGLTTSNPARPGVVKAEILVLNGADDPTVKTEHIARFRQEMEDAGVSYRFVNYPGAKHSFTNPDADLYGERFGLPLAYNSQADKQSWNEMKSFLDELFE